MAARFRPPRLTVARLMALMVPAALHLALARGWVRALAFPNPPAVALEVALLAGVGLAMVAFRRPSFLGGVVQMTVTPLAILPLTWARAEVGTVSPDVARVVMLTWSLAIEAAALSFLVRRGLGWWRPPAGPAADCGTRPRRGWPPSA